jgi:hypothetical protein
MIERYPLAKAGDAYARMMSGKAEFRVVLTMQGFAGPNAPRPCLRDDGLDEPNPVAQPVIVALSGGAGAFGLTDAEAVAIGA